MQKQHHIALLPGDVGDTVLLPGDPHRAQFIADHFDEAHFVAKNRQYVTYTGKYKGVKLSVTAPGIGCPAVAIAVEELIKVGAKNFIRVGTCGLLQEWLPPGSLIIATAAVRGDGCSREYFPLEYPAVADLDTLEAMLASAKRRRIKVHVGIIRGHDAFYMESVFARGDYLAREKHWIDAGVLATENESPLLFTLATVLKCRAGTILASVSSHQHPEQAVSPERLQELLHHATLIALDAAVALDKLEKKRQARA
jgi:uridine phosphorylase